MINFIKDAVTAVSGIKSFIYNTDYRNNFDIQDVEFPCCVLTPIMRTNYDLKNIIRESAELQLSVVDIAPYEYTGDDLYDINKRCSDLALQVIANLQVKSKLDKELTFEFILPSGDELISGVMCNLTATMKQGSCNGAPSYVEVVVQPVKRESITTNGTHTITPSSGFNAMREVEVEVIVPTTALATLDKTILENGEFEFLPNDGEAFDKVKIKTNVTMDIIDNLLSNRTDASLSANQGRILNNKKAEKIVIINQTNNIVEIQPNVLNVWGEIAELTITLATPTDTSIVNEYMVQFASGETATTLVLPDTIQWLSEPTVNPNATYQLSVVNNLAVIGEFSNE